MSMAESTQKGTYNDMKGMRELCCKIVRFPDKFLSLVFYNYGKSVAKFPLPMMVVSFVVLGLLCLGMIRVDTDFQEEDTIEAFISRSTWVADERKVFQKHWPVEDNRYWPAHLYDVPEMYVLYAQSKSKTSNVFDMDGLARILEFCQTFDQISEEIDGRETTFEDVCARWEGNCQRSIACTSMYLNLVSGYTVPYISAAFEPIMSLNNAESNNISVLMQNSSTVYANIITSATHAALYWYSKRTDQAEKWAEKAFGQLNDLRNKFNAESTNTYYYIYSYARARQEDSQSLQDDMYLLAIGAVLLVLYSVMVTFNLKAKGTRVLLTLAGLLSCLLSLGASFGVLIAAGVPFITFSLVIPFVVLGIGIDAVLVMSTEWAHLAHIADPVERVGRTMERSFMGVSLSHLTSLVAFLVGMISPFPAVDYLCGYMAVCIVFSWIGEGTFFLSCLCLHAYWVSPNQEGGANAKNNIAGNVTLGGEDSGANKLDLPAVVYVPPEEGSDGGVKVLTFNSSPREVFTTNRDISVVEACLLWFLPRFVVNKYVKCVLLFALGVGLGLAIVSVVNFPQEELYSMYYKDGSPIGEFYDARRADYPFSVVVQFVFEKHLDYSQNETRQQIQNFMDDLIETNLFAKFQTSWLDLFLQVWTLFSGGTPVATDEASFNVQVKTFLESMLVPSNPVLGPNTWLGEDVVFNDDNQIIRARFYAYLTAATNGGREESEKILDHLKQVLDRHRSTLNPASYTFIYSELERNALLEGEIWTSIAIVAVAAAVVSLFFIPSLTLYLLVIACFFCAMISAMGLMAAWGLTYSLASYVQIMLGFGLCVDYMAHIARGFIVAEGDTPRQRVKSTLGVVGVAMTNAVGTSILGIMMLSAAETFASRSFFKSMLCIFICSYVFGVWLLPAVISIALPNIYREPKKPNKDNPKVSPE